MRRLAAVLCMTLLWACGGDDDGGSEDPNDLLGINDGASRGETRRAIVERSTAASIQMSTGATLTVPAGAARERVELTMQRMPDDQARPLTARVAATYRISSAPYRMTPHGVQFDLPVQLSLPIARGDASRIKMAVLDDENDATWEIAPSRAAATAGSVVADIMHFSIWVLLEDISVPASTDAGMDGGTRDAQMMDVARIDIPDSTVASDGFVSAPDSSAIVDAAMPDAGLGNFMGRVLQKLQDCDMIEKTGDYNDHYATVTVTDALQRCETECMFQGSCEDFVQTSGYCGNFAEPPSFTACVQKCFGRAPSFQCMNAAGAMIYANSCDDMRECVDGADEAGCTPHRTCADGEMPESLNFCDYQRDCADGSDELNCPAAFACEDQSGAVPITRVCDTYRQCFDGSDEPDRCLKVKCPIITATAAAL